MKQFFLCGQIKNEIRKRGMNRKHFSLEDACLFTANIVIERANCLQQWLPVFFGEGYRQPHSVCMSLRNKTVVADSNFPFG